LSDGITEIHPQSEDCDQSHDQISYSANLLVYYGLYKSISPLPLTIGNFTAEPYNFQVPNFTAISSKLPRYAKLDSAQAFEIAYLESALNDSLETSSEDDESWILPFLSDTQSGYPKLDTLISAIVNILEVTAIIIISVKVGSMQRKISCIMLSMNRAEAFEFTLPTTQVPSVSNVTPDTLKIVLVILCAIAVLYSITQFGIIQMRKMGNSSEPESSVLESLKTEVYLCLYNVKEYAHIKVAIIPSVMNNIKFGKVGNICSISFKRKFLSPFLKIDWTPILITEDKIGKITLPNYIQLPFFSYQKVNRLIQTSALVKVILVSGNDWAEVCSTSEVINTEERYQPVSKRHNLSEVIVKGPSANHGDTGTEGAKERQIIF
jgi:hypothetical protein